MKSHSFKNVFVVVKVHSGIPVIAEAFTEEDSARKRAKALHRDFNLDYDAIGLFCSPVKRGPRKRGEKRQPSVCLSWEG